MFLKLVPTAPEPRPEVTLHQTGELSQWPQQPLHSLTPVLLPDNSSPAGLTPGIPRRPALSNLSMSHSSLYRLLDSNTNAVYAHALIHIRYWHYAQKHMNAHALIFSYWKTLDLPYIDWTLLSKTLTLNRYVEDTRTPVFILTSVIQKALKQSIIVLELFPLGNQIKNWSFHSYMLTVVFCV